MLARFARRLLFIEFAVYAAAAAWLIRLGLGWAAALGCVLGIALLYRIASVVGTFVLAAALAPAGRAAPCSALERARLVAREVLWTSFAYGLFMSFPRAFVRAGPRLPRNAATLPVLLVHGYVCNSGIWAGMQRFLASRGVNGYTHDLEPLGADIDDYVAGLDRRIEAVCAATGAPKLVVVAHSMGGLAARAYLRARGGARVAKLVTLGTPHHGTLLARIGIGTNARQMEPGSDWLAELGRAAPPEVPVASIYSAHDNIVVPQESAALEGAANVRISGIGHVSLPFTRSVQERLLGEILACGAH